MSVHAPVTLLLAAAHHAGTSTGAGHGSGTAQTVSASSLLVQMVIGLVVVVGLIKVGSRLLQGKAGKALGPGRRPGPVAVLGRQSLGKGVQVAVVSAADQAYLVGVTQQQVTMLGQLVPGADPGSTTVVPIGGTGAESATADPTGGADPAGPGLQLLRGEPDPGAGGDGAPWRSAIEQIRAKTVRRA